MGLRSKNNYINLVVILLTINLISVLFTILAGYILGNLISKVISIVFGILVIIIEGILFNKKLKYEKMNLYIFALILNIVSSICFTIFTLIK